MPALPIHPPSRLVLALAGYLAVPPVAGLDAAPSRQDPVPDPAPSVAGPAPEMARHRGARHGYPLNGGGAAAPRLGTSVVRPGAGHRPRPSSPGDLDDLDDLLSEDGFNTLKDGQPGDPGAIDLKFDAGWVDAPTRKGDFELDLRHTPGGGWIGRNMQLVLIFPFEATGDRLQAGDLETQWLQRWIVDLGRALTASTIVAVQYPTSPGSSGVDVALTAIGARGVGDNVFYLNVFGEFDGLEDATDVGGRVGYKRDVDETVAVVLDYVLEAAEGTAPSHVLEVSGQYAVSPGFTLALGVFLGLDDNENTSRFTAGVHLALQL